MMVNCATALGLVMIVVAANAPAQTVAEVQPAVARLAKTYATAPDGQDFFKILSVAVDPLSGALWVSYSKEDDPPVRIDRTTDVGKVIGRTGSGPNEYRRIIAMLPGPKGEMGIWDPARRSWFWVDSAGVQRRTWSVPTSSMMYGKVFTDNRGAVYLGQPGSLTPIGMAATTVVVRVDSAKGFRDTTPIPIKDPQRGIWGYSSAVPNGGRGWSSTRVLFSPSVDWGVDRRGRIFAAWTDSNYVVVRDGRNETRLLIPSWREPLTAADRKRASDVLDQFEATAKSRGGVFEGTRPAIPETKPQITSLMPEMNGGIIVRRTRSCANFPTWRAPITGAVAAADTARCTVVERFDESGRRQTPFTLATGDQLMVMRADTAWVTRTDSDGLMKILELVVPRR